MVDAVIPSLLQFDENDNRTRRMTDVIVQLTFRQPLGRALGRRCFQSNGLRPHCQQYPLKVIADEFVPSARGMALVGDVPPTMI